MVYSNPLLAPQGPVFYIYYLEETRQSLPSPYTFMVYFEAGSPAGPGVHQLVNSPKACVCLSGPGVAYVHCQPSFEVGAGAQIQACSSSTLSAELLPLSILPPSNKTVVKVWTLDSEYPNVT